MCVVEQGEVGPDLQPAGVCVGGGRVGCRFEQVMQTGFNEIEGDAEFRSSRPSVTTFRPV